MDPFRNKSLDPSRDKMAGKVVSLLFISLPAPAAPPAHCPSLAKRMPSLFALEPSLSAVLAVSHDFFFIDWRLVSLGLLTPAPQVLECPVWSPWVFQDCWNILP